MSTDASRESLWRTPDHVRNFIVSDCCTFKAGSFLVRSLDGREFLADERWLRRFEVSKQEAYDWAKQELESSLDRAKTEIHANLLRVRAALQEARVAPVKEDSDLTADALPSLISLLVKLPRAIVNSLSSSAHQVECAKRDLKNVQERLRAAGIDVGDKLEHFPDRLATLRSDAANRKRRKN